MGPPPRQPFASDDDEISKAARVPTPSRGSRRKNASNVPMPLVTHDIVKANFKKASFWERNPCCMNVDIHKQHHASYKSNRRIEKLLKEIKAQGEAYDEEGEAEYTDEHGA